MGENDNKNVCLNAWRYVDFLFFLSSSHQCEWNTTFLRFFGVLLGLVCSVH